jgi:S1-C subfamily serine protease
VSTGSHSARATNRTAVAAIAGVLIVGALGAAAFWRSGSERKPTKAPEPTVPAAEASLPPPPRREEPVNSEAAADPLEPLKLLTVEEIVSRSLPSVVTVETADGLGSGFFVEPGTVVTNSHVVRGSTSVNLRRPGGYLHAAKVEKNSPELDLAILKLDLVDLGQPVLPVADVSDVHVGAEVVAIGSPLGLANSVTRGIVSGVRERDGVRLIQTDAAINPGNSGGPLLDRYGRVLGVNTMKLVARDVNGMAFAVSIHYARALLPGFAPNADRTARYEQGVRDYTERVRAAAEQADRIDKSWKSFYSSCVGESGRADADHAWFALRDGTLPGVRSSDSCRAWVDYFKESAGKVHDALARCETTARQAGVSTDQMRTIRRRYNVEWTGWNQ